MKKNVLELKHKLEENPNKVPVYYSILPDDTPEDFIYFDRIGNANKNTVDFADNEIHSYRATYIIRHIYKEPLGNISDWFAYKLGIFQVGKSFKGNGIEDDIFQDYFQDDYFIEEFDDLDVNYTKDGK